MSRNSVDVMRAKRRRPPVSGPGIWALAIGGLILVNLGYLLLTAYYRTRELLAMVAGGCDGCSRQFLTSFRSSLQS